MKQSDAAKWTDPIPNPDCASCTTTKRYTAAIAVAADSLLAVIWEVAPIPANCRVTEIVIDADDLDTNGAPAIAFDVGILSGEFGDNDDARTIGAEFFAATTVGQAGGVARPTLKTAYRTSPVDYMRGIGIKFTAAPATFAAGTIGLTVTIASA